MATRLGTRRHPRLVSHGRLAFSGAQERSGASKLTNGRRSNEEIDRKTWRALSLTLQGMEKYRDWLLVGVKTNSKVVDDIGWSR